MPTPLCGVCQVTEFKYTCPRCELLYCSLSCYKKHSEKCTERFYQDQVNAALSAEKVTEEERRRLEFILAKLNNLEEDNDSNSEDDGTCEEERLSSLLAKAESGELGLEDLTPEEVQRFHSELKRGALGQSIGAWEPWWLRAALEEVQCEKGSPFRPPSHICCTNGKDANPAVALTILEVVYSYAHTMRAFNGDCSWDPLQPASHLSQLAPALGEHRLHGSVTECLSAGLGLAATLPGGGFGTTLDNLCLQDTATILSGGVLRVPRALRDAAELTEAASRAAGSKKAATSWQRASRKLAFLESFAHFHDDILQPLLVQVEAYLEQRNAELQSRRDSENARAHGGIALPEMD
mmetsp:Transcript_69483/g.166546  ORF Transcript_69483/g.166546 Transcript_69483/m.166546 type:complete len:351 (+) Transcript_69483:56-1108(+)